MGPDMISAASSNFLECWFLDERSEEKISCTAREPERRCKPSPLGSRSKAPENFGYFAFWIAQNIAFLALSPRMMTKACTRNQQFWEFQGLSLGSQTSIPVWVQNSSGYGSADPPVNYSQSQGVPKFFIKEALFHGDLSWNNLLEYLYHKNS